MIKVLLYCEEAKRNEELLCPIYDPLDGKPTWVFGHKDIPPINGLICFECDMNEIFVEDWGRKDRIKVTNQETTMDLSYNVNDIVGLMMDIESQIGISNEELVKYVGNGKEFTDLFYVYHLENIHQIDPNAILYKNKLMKKKIVLLQHYFNDIGGIETFLINFCKTFSQEYDITLVCREIGWETR